MHPGPGALHRLPEASPLRHDRSTAGYQPTYKHSYLLHSTILPLNNRLLCHPRAAFVLSWQPGTCHPITAMVTVELQVPLPSWPWRPVPSSLHVMPKQSRLHSESHTGLATALIPGSQWLCCIFEPHSGLSVSEDSGRDGGWRPRWSRGKGTYIPGSQERCREIMDGLDHRLVFQGLDVTACLVDPSLAGYLGFLYKAARSL